jgi:hypothetical protein
MIPAITTGLCTALVVAFFAVSLTPFRYEAQAQTDRSASSIL